MSGTSLDGIDAAIVDFTDNNICLLNSHYQPYPKSVRQKLRNICNGNGSIQDLAEMDSVLGQLYSESVLTLLEESALNKEDIKAIGNHGQTICHHPKQPNPYTLQIGDPNIIAELTGISVAADFRRRDIAVGGQGAPLVPAFHQAIFRSSTESRAIINIGGISNITYLPHSQVEKVSGFDCGPGNTLMDYWVENHSGKMFDDNGQWACSGKVSQPLLQHLLTDPFFALSPPKSTGTDYFSPDWLEERLNELELNIAEEDIQATLTELTAQTISSAVKKLSTEPVNLYICGGGARNSYLVERLKLISGSPVQTTESLSVSPDWVEAMAFAWLARQTVKGSPGNLPEVTGASRPVILGGLYRP